jgi:hypothetical protein
VNDTPGQVRARSDRAWDSLYESAPCAPIGGWQLTHFGLPSTVKVSLMSVAKIQVGQLWRKDATGDIYLVTRLYSEALHTMVILRKSGAEGEAQLRVRVERAGQSQTIPGFSPAQEDESL